MAEEPDRNATRVGTVRYRMREPHGRGVSIDIQARGAHSSSMLMVAIYYLKLPREGREAAGI